MDHGLGEADALQHSLRVGANRPPGGFIHRGQAQRILNGSIKIGGGDATELCAIAHEFAARKELMEIGSFRQEAGATTRGAGGGRFAEDTDFTSGRGEETQDDLECGALTAAVGPE